MAGIVVKVTNLTDHSVTIFSVKCILSIVLLCGCWPDKIIFADIIQLLRDIQGKFTLCLNGQIGLDLSRKCIIIAFCKYLPIIRN